MENDEADFIRSDWDTYNNERKLDSCSYCSEELDNLNVVHYQYNLKESGHFKIVAVNPMPHDKIVVEKGCERMTELVCNRCLKDELGHEGH